MEKTEIFWSASEYEHRQKTTEWFWTLGIITLAISIAALLLRNLLFAIFTALAGFTVALYGAKKPGVVDFEISARGIKIADRLYTYDSLKSFWIRYNPPDKKEVEVMSKKIFMPRLVLPLGDADPNEIRAVLSRALKEEEAKESLAETVAERLGF